MKKMILATVLASTLSFAHAAPYPKHDLSKIVTPTSVNFEMAERVYQDLSRHAAMYPTQFDNAKDKNLAAQEAKELARIFNGLLATKIITPQHDGYRAILHRAARVNWMAHNLDVPQAAAATDQHYQTLLAALSGKEKTSLMSEYGSFLTSVGHTDKAITLLKQSVKDGNTAAKFELAVALLTQGKQAEAEKNLREYVQAHPQNTQAKQLLQAVQSGKIEVKTAQ